MEHRSTITIQCREDYRRGDLGYEDLGSVGGGRADSVLGGERRLLRGSDNVQVETQVGQRGVENGSTRSSQAYASTRSLV